MKKQIVHKLDKDVPIGKTVVCKKSLLEFSDKEMFTREWEKVTCKECLKQKS